MSRAANQYLNVVDKNEAGQIFDYAHASQLFIADDFKLQPKYSFLYHVRFERDRELSVIQDNAPLHETGMLVQSVALPKFTMDTKTLNAYNRTNIIQTKIKYDPVQITFHDDGNNVILDFWRDYSQYYFRDTDYNKDLLGDFNPSTYQKNHKYNFNAADPLNNWGYTLRNNANTQHFLKNIRIYSLNRTTFTEYMLVNPIITSFQHGQHTAGENSLMSHTMTVAYESVLYFTGYVTDASIPGMVDLHYDRRISPLTPAGLGGPFTSGGPASVGGVGGGGPGSGGGLQRPRVFGARSIIGPGGIFDTSDQVLGDIKNGNFRGAIQKSYKSWQNNKNVNLRNLVKMEAKQALLTGILTGTNPFSGVNIPIVNNVANGVGAAIKDGANWTKEKFGIKRADNTPSNLASTQKFPVQYEAYGRTQTDNTTPQYGIVSNGGDVARTSGPSMNLFNSPVQGLPRDNTADIGSDYSPTAAPAPYAPYYVRPINNPPQEISNQRSTEQPGGFGAAGSGGTSI